MESVSYQAAPIWRRFAAIGYDSLLVVALAFLAGFINLGIQMAIFGEAELRRMTENGHSLDGLPFYIVLIVLVYGFFGFFWTRTGQTLGMQAWRLRILDRDHQLISPKQSIIRFIIAAPALFLAGLGIFWALFDRNNRSWQDIVSATITVVEPKR